MQYFLYLSVLFLIIGCGSTSNKEIVQKAILSTDNLPTDSFTINVSRDTVLKGRNGTIISINKGSIVSSKPTITLVLKEAYSLAQILAAGLTTTTTDGKILSTGGMFYLNVVDDNTAKIKGGIGVKVPTEERIANMQLFKGENKAGNITWGDTTSLKSYAAAGEPDGRLLFQTNCAACHSISKDGVGPALGGINYRRTKEWFHKFTNNWEQMVASGDCFANQIKDWSSSAMTKFNLSKKESDAIYDYLAEASIPMDSALLLRYDSCNRYREKQAELQRLEAEKRQLVLGNGPPVEQITQPTNVSVSNSPDGTMPRDISNFVDVISPTSEYYNVTIQDFGWFNIDKLFDMPECSLFVTLDEKYKGKVALYLMLPDERVFLRGGIAEGNQYAFKTKDGKLNLPIGKNATLLAVGEVEGKFLYNRKQIPITQSMNIAMDVNETTPNEMNKDIAALGWKELDIKAGVAKNAGAIQEVNYKIDKIKKLKPKFECDCEIKKVTPLPDERVAFR